MSFRQVDLKNNREETESLDAYNPLTDGLSVHYETVPISGKPVHVTPANLASVASCDCASRAFAEVAEAETQQGFMETGAVQHIMQAALRDSRR